MPLWHITIFLLTKHSSLLHNNDLLCNLNSILSFIGLTLDRIVRTNCVKLDCNKICPIAQLDKSVTCQTVENKLFWCSVKLPWWYCHTSIWMCQKLIFNSKMNFFSKSFDVTLVIPVTRVSKWGAEKGQKGPVRISWFSSI